MKNEKKKTGIGGDNDDDDDDNTQGIEGEEQNE